MSTTSFWWTLAGLIVCLGLLLGCTIFASAVQDDFGELKVSNVRYRNYNGITVRAKLFRPLLASQANRLPGVVYLHGYQNNRETGDAYCLELARRGFVVLNVDLIGRGNSGLPGDPKAPGFDPTFGGKRSVAYLRSLKFVDKERIGLAGHSLGAEMAYHIAMKDPTIRALVITGFAYTQVATPHSPKNMLMIIGKWDEFRKRMTGVQNIERDWMRTLQTKRAIARPNPRLGRTYGDFSRGTARMVLAPATVHVQESHHGPSIAATLEWMRKALKPPPALWVNPANQIWHLKEWATLGAMVGGLGSLLPLGALLLMLPFFSSLTPPFPRQYTGTWKSYCKLTCGNGLLMWLYLPLILSLFAIHIYIVRIDRAFPLMMVNGIVWWFLVINLLGFFWFKRWYRKKHLSQGVTLRDLGVSFADDRFTLDKANLAKTVLLALILAGFAYGAQHCLEKFFIIDWRFIFPFFSDLTPARALLALRYFPFILAGFLMLGIFLHGQLGLPSRSTHLRTLIFRSFFATLSLALPVISILAVQYIPLFTTGGIPFSGPGGMFVAFILNLFHLLLVFALTIPISTWFHQLTGKIYLGALVNSFLVTWMFLSAQVIAPVPVPT